MQLSIKHNLFTFFLVAQWLLLSAQNYPSKNISTLNGLPDNQVEAIFKDSKGFLWVGTQNGLAKISNNDITNYYSEDGLPNNAVWAIKEDTSGNLWLGTYGGGITKFNGTKFKSYNKNKKLANSNVRKLFIFKENLFIGTEKGLFVLDLKTDELIDLETERDQFQIMDFIVHNENIYMGVYLKGVFKYDFKNKKLIKIRVTDNNNSGLFSLFINGNELYIGHLANKINSKNLTDTKAIDSYNIDDFLSGKPIKNTFGNSIVWDYFKDDDGFLYGAAWGVHSADGGVYKFINHQFKNMTNEFGISSKQIRRFYYDNSLKKLWVGTQDKGLFIVDLDKAILFYKTANYKVKDFLKIKGNIIFLHDNGLSINNENKIINIDETKFYDALIQHLNRYNFKYYEIIKNTVSSKDILFYQLKYKYNYFWINTNYGLFKIDENSLKIEHNAPHPNVFEFDNKGNLYLAINFGQLCIYEDIINHRIYSGRDDLNKEFCYDQFNKNNPYNVTSMAKFKNKLFVSSPKNGLYRTDFKTFTSLYETGDFKEKQINYLSHAENSQLLYIATNSGGVFAADVKTDFKILKKYERSDYFGNSILFIENYKNTVLVGTEKGITILKEDSKIFLDQEQGVYMDNFLNAKVIDNSLYYSSDEGYYILNLDKLAFPKKREIKLTLDKLIVNNSNDIFNENKRDIDFYKEIKLPYNFNNLDLYFTSSSHPFPTKLEYSYQIKGLNENWNPNIFSNRIQLNFLPSGRYDINVKIKDLSTGATSQRKLTSIIITPPFWNTWWFISIAFFIFLLTVYLIYKKRIEIVKKREEEKSRIYKRLTDTKLEALRSQMNPHFVFNSLNSIQNYVIDNDVDNALLYLSEFAKLMRKTLNNSSLKTISLSDEIDYLESYIALENMRFSNVVQTSIKKDDFDTEDVYIAPMLIQPFVENAFIHAFTKDIKQPKLEIHFSCTKDVLICEITDNGKGMDTNSSNKLHNSKGLKLVAKRLQLFNKSSKNSYSINSEKNVGTKIRIELELSSFND